MSTYRSGEDCGIRKNTVIHSTAPEIIAGGQSAPYMVPITGCLYTIWGSKCPPGSIFRGTNQEIEGLCPPGTLWCKPCINQ